jgi:hypothetical protein
VDGRSETCLGYSDDRDAELLVGVCAEPRPAGRVQRHVTVDDEQVEVVDAAITTVFSETIVPNAASEAKTRAARAPPAGG